MHLQAHSPPALAADLAAWARACTAESPTAALVCNGDLFDLDRVAGEPGAGWGADRAAVRLASILDSWPDVQAALRDHLAAGGALVFLAGNHDAELLLPEVQSALRHRLEHGAAAQASGSPDVIVAEELAMPGLWIRHGHQVDPDSAFDPDMRTALASSGPGALPLASLMTRVLLSRIPRFELGDDHRTAPVRVLLRVIRDYRADALVMILLFPVAAIRIIAWSVAARTQGKRPCDPQAATMSCPWAVVRRLYLDRYMATVAALALGIAIGLGWQGRVAWASLAVLGVGLLIPPPRRAIYRTRDAHRAEEEARRRIAAGTRVVVQGHTHQAYVRALGEGIVANHGAFSAAVAPRGGTAEIGAGETNPSRRSRHFLEIRSPGLLCTLRVTGVAARS